MIILGKLYFSLTFHPLIFIAYASQIIDFRHFKVIFFGNITVDISDDISSDLGYAVVAKGRVSFWTKVTIFVKSWSDICVEMQKNAGNQGGDVQNQGENFGIAVEMK